MKFTTDANVNGTSLKGYIVADYDQLVKVFGQPAFGGDKINVVWELAFEDGTVATIYDWKEPAVPMGRYAWHIGGKTQAAVDHVIDTFSAVEA